MIILIPTVLLGVCAPAAEVFERSNHTLGFSLLSNLTSNMELPAHPTIVSFGGFGPVGSAVVLSNFPRENSSHTATVSADDGSWVMTMVSAARGTSSNLTFRSAEDPSVEIVLTNISFVDQDLDGLPSVARRLQSQACPSCSMACDNALSRSCHLMFGEGASCLTCTGLHQATLRQAGCSNANLQQYCAAPPPPPPAPKNNCWATSSCACSLCNCAGKTSGGCSNAGIGYCDCFGYCSKCH